MPSAESLTLADLLNTISTLGVTGLLVVFLWGFRQKWWVMGWQYQEIVKDRDEFKGLLWKVTNMAERATNVGERAVRAVEEK